MTDIIESYIKAWNDLNVQEVADYFHDKAEHHSQVVLEVLKGKSKVIDYLSNKFEAIKRSNEPIKMYLAKYQGNFCVAMFQLLNQPEINPFASGKGNIKKPYRSGVITFKFQDDKIIRTCFCIIPTINEIEFL